MIGTRILALSIASLVLSSSVGSAQDLSRSRQFEIGMSVSAVAHQALDRIAQIEVPGGDRSR